MTPRFLLVLLVLLALLAAPVDSKRRKKASAKRAVEEDTIVYTSEEDKQRKLAELRKKSMGDAKPDPANAERAKLKLRVEEGGLRKDVARAVATYGEDSKEKAAALHKLGRNVYMQDRFDETFELSLEIARIHGVVDGKDSTEYADALGNIGSVANRLKETRLCEAVMKRQLRILLDKHGVESKEVLIQRARMMSFRIMDGETSDGYLQDYFDDELSEIEAARAKERKMVEEL